MNGGHVVGPGGGVFIPGDACGRLALVLERGARAVAATDGMVLSDLGDAITLLKAAAAVHRQTLRLTIADLTAKRSADCGPLLDSDVETAEDSEMTVKGAAEVINVTERHVRRLAVKGRIQGRLDGQTWRLHPPSVVSFASSRQMQRKRRG